MPHDFVIADVFAEHPYGGNQLAVVPRADGLSTQRMQSIAREFNFSETTFVLPPTLPGADYHLRIFTPHEELHFAGHPTVGSAAVLAESGIVTLQAGTGTVVFQEGVGLVPVAIRIADATLWSRLTVHSAPEMPGGAPSTDILAAILSVPPACVLDGWFGGLGNPFCFVHLASPEFVDTAVLDRPSWSRHLKSAWAPQLFFFAGDLTHGDLYARMFAPVLGIEEDPATGSAAAILAGCIAARRLAPDCEVTLTIAQGVHMGRPSRLEAAASKTAGQVRGISVAGQTIIVATGRLR